MRSLLVSLCAPPLFLCLSSALVAANCAPPPPVLDEQKTIDTEGAVGKLLNVVGVNAKVEISGQKKAIFAAYPNADQMVVVLSIIYNICSSQMSDADKATMQSAILTEFLRNRAQGPQPLSSTAPQRPSPENEVGGEKHSGLNRLLQRVAMRNDAAGVSNADRKTSWADIYLNPSPLLITEKNKFFVIVGSASSEVEGNSRLHYLKSRYPDYDFELFGPYGSNTSYGIMIASWVSAERAHAALAIAKKIEPTSFIWSCRNTGEAC